MNAKSELLNLLNDPSVNEIYADGLRSVHVKGTANNAKLRRVSTRFKSERQLAQAIEAYLKGMGVTSIKNSPMLSQKLSSGAQIYATFPPVTLAGPTLTVIKASCWDQTRFENVTGWAIASRDDLSMYEFRVEKIGDTNAAYILATEKAIEDAGGCIYQGIRGFGYRGGKIRLSAAIKTDSAYRAGLFLRVDNEEEAAATCGQMNPIEGTTDWQLCDIEVAVPDNATLIVFGFWLSFKGAMWVKNLKFDVLEQPPKTRRKKAPQQRPVNLGFEVND